MFFSDNPVFVEGILDAWMVHGLMEALGNSMAGAGSCVIDANGVDEVNQYLKLSQGLGKDAHFLYDLDALFKGTLRRCIEEDESIQNFLITAGLGGDIAKYCGDLFQRVSALIDKLLSGSFTPNLSGLKAFLDKMGPRSKWGKQQHAGSRVALMTAISKYRADVVSQSSEVEVADLEARLSKILAALDEKNIHVLPGGTLERYLPLFQGAEFDPAPDQKRDAVLAELEAISNIAAEEELECRYTDLYKAVRKLPSKESVNLDVVLYRRLATYIYALQQTVVEYPDWDQQKVRERMKSTIPEYEGVFSIQRFKSHPPNGFEATILVANLLNQGPKHAEITDQTNAGMSRFQLKSADPEVTDSVGGPAVP